MVLLVVLLVVMIVREVIVREVSLPFIAYLFFASPDIFLLCMRARTYVVHQVYA